MRYGFCCFLNPGISRLSVISDSVIALSCYAIFGILLAIVCKRRDLRFHWAFVTLSAFIVACGSVQLMEIWNVWRANNWSDEVVKAIAAAASVLTAVVLLRVAPKAFQLPARAQWDRAKAKFEEEIRERRDAELDLRVSEAGYRKLAQLLDLTHDAMFVRELDRKITFWNRGAERLYGWQADEVRGRVAEDLLQTSFPAPLREIEAVVTELGFWEGELVQRGRSGGEIVVSSRWALRRDATGAPAAILVTNRDVTQRVREEKKFRNLLESAPDAIVIVSRDGRIQLVNAQAERLFGYRRAELIGQPVEILMPKRFHDSHVKQRGVFTQSPHTRPMGAGLELYGLRKDGTQFPLEVSLSPLETSEGTLISSAIRDVTDRKASEENVRRLNEELRRKVAEITAANRELETFSYSVSHDLRAPLRHIDGFARILREEQAHELSDDGRRHLDRILGAVTHMGHLVDDLLALARIGRKELSRQRVRLDEVARQAIVELPPEEQRRPIEWKIDSLPEVDGDPGLLKLVFSNLLSNAAKFTRTRQTAVIEVGARGPETMPEIFVRDNGVGFDPKYADKLFGVFQRLHRQEDFEGTGIGLATVQRIVHRHGGEVRAEAAPDQGATFYFTLNAGPLQNGASAATEVKN